MASVYLKCSILIIFCIIVMVNSAPKPSGTTGTGCGPCGPCGGGGKTGGGKTGGGKTGGGKTGGSKPGTSKPPPSKKAPAGGKTDGKGKPAPQHGRVNSEGNYVFGGKDVMWPFP